MIPRPEGPFPAAHLSDETEELLEAAPGDMLPAASCPQCRFMLSFPVGTDLMEIPCCPVCESDVTLLTGRQQGEEVIEGNLACAGCPAEYPLTDGIPDLLPPDPPD